MKPKDAKLMYIYSYRSLLMYKTETLRIHVATNHTKINGFMNFPLVQNEVLVFYGKLNDFDALNCRSLLSNQERFRATQFQLDKDKSNFIISKAILKSLLAYFSNKSEMKIDFRYGKNGKPYLSDNSNVQFNCSHSESAVVIAIALGMEIGIDLEQLSRKVNRSRLASFLFTPTELIAYHQLEEMHQQQFFMDLWTTKEAILKATGEGLTRPMNTLTVALNEEKKLTLEMTGESSENNTDWFLESYTLMEDYTGALAVRGNVNRVQYIQINEADLFTNKSF